MSGANVSITDHLGSSVAEINFDGTHYTEFSGTAFAKVRGGPLEADITGATPGVMSVAKGQLQYSIPINLPEGSAGINPSFSIDYSSGAGYGHLGMGFSISGLSSIDRCSTDYIRDGQVNGVTGAASDRACLNGTRLVLALGEYLSLIHI